MTDTQPFLDEARLVCNGFFTAHRELYVEDVATALSSAYQRGREKERERCANLLSRSAARFTVHSQNPAKSEDAAEICRINARLVAGYADLIRTERDKG